MKILVTGANGYLAKHLISSFSEHTVYSLTRENWTKDLLLNFKPDLIVHTIASYARNNETISETYESNLFSGIRLLEAASELVTPLTFINCGTSLVKETNLYSISKAQFVEFGRFISSDRLQFINMKLEHFYGFGALNNFLSFIVGECKKNIDIPLTSGYQKRDFIYIDDVCEAFNSVINNKDEFECFETIDVGTGVCNSIRGVVEKIKLITNSSSNLRFGQVPLRQNEVAEIRADITKLQSIGWNPRHTLDEGLLKII